MSTDYSELDNADLNRIIAERRGFKDLIVADNGWKDIWVVADGKEQPLPDWARDLNAAAELLKDMILGALFRDDGATTDWNVTAYIDGFGMVVDVHHESPSRAICLGYLAYTDQFSASGFYPATGRGPVMLAARAPLPVDADDSDGGWMDGLD